MARQIDYYFSMASPWAYIGHALFQNLATSHGCKVAYKPVFLGELFAETGGLPLAKRHPARQRYRMMELQRWREKRGLNFHLQPQHWPFDPKPADGVVVAAIEAGLDPEPFMRLRVQSHLGRSAQSRRSGNDHRTCQQGGPAGREAGRTRCVCGDR